MKSISETVFGETECGSKSYLTPNEANARQKEEVIKKTKERTFTLAELEKYDYAIEAFEKDHNIIYLPE